jgi:hypothetical protein
MTQNSRIFADGFKSGIKPLAGSFLCGVVITLIFGFAILDWRTAGSANSMTQHAVTNATAELASAVCVERFMNSPDATANFAELKAAKSWDRGNLIEKGGWLSFSQVDHELPGAANLCANKLSELDRTGSGSGKTDS